MSEEPMDKPLDKRSFCKWEKRDILKNIQKIYTLTSNPNYVCEKCARVSTSKTNVCKPRQFKPTT